MNHRSSGGMPPAAGRQGVPGQGAFGQGAFEQGAPRTPVAAFGQIVIIVMLLLFVAMSVDQAAKQFGITWAMAKAAVSPFAWLYTAIAAAGLAVVAVGLVYEAFVAQDASRQPGPLASILDRLTNRPALQAAVVRPASAEVIDADALSTRLKARVIGQDAVCDDLAIQLRRRMALAQRDKPVGIFLLAGPPGTGKSYLAKRLAADLGHKLVAFDMAQFANGLGATMMFGAPKGYVGSGVYGALTAALQEAPNAVVLLDEIEKAHHEVHKRFLTAWNDGYVTELSDGNQVPANQAIFMLTSNAATDALMRVHDRHAGHPDEMRRNAMAVLREAGFAPEVLNRIDRVFIFRPLSGADIARVAVLEIEAVAGAYGMKIADGGIDPELLAHMTRRQQGMGAAASARDLARSIEDTISDALITAKQQNARTVSLTARNGRIVAEIAS